MSATARIDSTPPAPPGSVAWYEPGILLCQAPVDQSPASIRAFYTAVRDAVTSSAGYYVMITDTRRLATMPDAVARRIHGEQAKSLVAEGAHRRVVSITIVENAVVRATVTAIRWLLGENRVRTAIVGDLDEALVVARRALRG